MSRPQTRKSKGSRDDQGSEGPSIEGLKFRSEDNSSSDEDRDDNNTEGVDMVVVLEEAQNPEVELLHEMGENTLTKRDIDIFEQRITRARSTASQATSRESSPTKSKSDQGGLVNTPGKKRGRGRGGRGKQGRGTRGSLALQTSEGVTISDPTTFLKPVTEDASTDNTSSDDEADMQRKNKDNSTSEDYQYPTAFSPPKSPTNEATRRVNFDLGSVLNTLEGMELADNPPSIRRVKVSSNPEVMPLPVGVRDLLGVAEKSLELIKEIATRVNNSEESSADIYSTVLTLAGEIRNIKDHVNKFVKDTSEVVTQLRVFKTDIITEVNSIKAMISGLINQVPAQPNTSLVSTYVATAGLSTSQASSEVKTKVYMYYEKLLGKRARDKGLSDAVVLQLLRALEVYHEDGNCQGFLDKFKFAQVPIAKMAVKKLIRGKRDDIYVESLLGELQSSELEPPTKKSRTEQMSQEGLLDTRPW